MNNKMRCSYCGGTMIADGQNWECSCGASRSLVTRTPWRQEGTKIIGQGDVIIADLKKHWGTPMCSCPAGTQEANAALIVAAANSHEALLAACRMMDGLNHGGTIPWVHNAGVTQDIEALRAICLAFSAVWNSTMYPAIVRATN